MELLAIATYLVCDKVLTTLGIDDDPQARMGNAEIMTLSVRASTERGFMIRVIGGILAYSISLLA